MTIAEDLASGEAISDGLGTSEEEIAEGSEEEVQGEFLGVKSNTEKSEEPEEPEVCLMIKKTLRD